MARVEVRSADEYNQFLKKHEEDLVVAYFWASWAPQCQQMSDIVDELAKDSKLYTVRFVGIEAEKLPQLVEQYKIDSVPVFIFIRKSNEVDRVLGADGAELNKKIRRNVDNHVPSRAAKAASAKSLDEKLKDLVNHDKVMLFMKGSPTEPRCGFSKQIVAMLNSHQVKYSTFDILSDSDVREGLKKFSNWPTYPQLYVNGELIGGLDIVKELDTSGELQQTLQV